MSHAGSDKLNWVYWARVGKQVGYAVAKKIQQTCDTLITKISYWRNFNLFYFHVSWKICFAT